MDTSSANPTITSSSYAMTSIISTQNLLVLTAAFFTGGVVKGVIGTGLPTVALALLTATLGLKEGMAIILLPSIITNIHQGLLSGNLTAVARRSWSFLLATFCTVWIGAAYITRVDITSLSALLGTILLIYAMIGLTAGRMPNPGKAEPWLNPIIGAVNGLLTGLTGSSVIPGVLYLQSLGLNRDLLIQTMGLLFLTSTTTLAFALKKNDLLTTELFMLSAFAFIPAAAGMRIGIHIRNNISEKMFKQLFFLFMLFLSLYIITRAVIHNLI